MEFTTNIIGSTVFQSMLVRQEDLPDEFVIKMLTNNEIEGLLPLSVIQKNFDFDIRYNVTSLVPLTQFMQDRFTKKQVLNVIASIVKATTNADEYMLSPNGLLMDEKYIYVNITEGEAFLMYLPIANPYSTDVVSFVKKLFTSFQYDPNEDSGYVLKFMNAFNSGTIQTVDDLSDFIMSVEKNAGNKSVVQKNTVSAHNPMPMNNVTPEPKVTNVPAEKPIANAVTPSSSVSTPAIPVSSNDNAKAKPFLFGKSSTPKTEKPKQEKPKPDKPKNKLFGGKSEEKSASAVIPVRIPGEAGATPNFAIPGASNATPSFAIPGQAAPVSAPKEPLTGEGTFDADVKDIDISGKPLTPQEENMAQAKAPIPNVLRDYGNTIVMNENNSTVTTMLDDSEANSNGPVRASVTRTSNNQKMYVEKGILKMGKESDYVDFYIGNNPTISRSHADIVCEDGKYYIRDNNSKNHTYVNGQQIVPGTLVQLENNTEIKLSNEVFVFQLS